MRIVVDEKNAASVERPDDFNAFDARLAVPADAALPQGLARDGGHVWVDEAWLRGELERLAPAAGWREKYDAMLAYAKRKGWTREAPLTIRAHITP